MPAGMISKLLAGIFIFMAFSSKAQQQKADTTVILNSVTKLSPAPAHKKLWALNPVKTVLFLSLRLYQKVLSEQISAICEYDLSCSAYSFEAIRKKGIIKGLLLTADRLTRCNGQAQAETESIHINHQSGKVIDTPDMY